MFDFNLLKILFSELNRYKLTILLFILLFVVCFFRSYYVFLNRKSTVIIDQLISTKDHLNNNWHHLLLEEKVYSDFNRIRKIASEELGLISPSSTKIKVIYIDENKK